MRILVVNAGSSSLKLRLVDEDGALGGTADLPPIDPGAPPPAELRTALAEFAGADAIGHRVVHGGLDFTAPALVDEAALHAIEKLEPLAPLHQPRCVAGIRYAAELLPGVPQVACFDTAFHATMPAAASTYPLPAAWRERWPLRRFGFHGLSHSWAARRAAELLGRDDAGWRLVTCHLGAGASLAAVAGGRSVATTMGFTPLEGLVMATRSGSIDPGLVLWLQQHGGLPAAEVADGLEHASGLQGLAGTDDMREVLARADRGDPAATLAIDVYLDRLRGGIATMAAALGGLDGLVFTGGVGERAPAIRAGAADRLGFLGLAVDAARNDLAVDGIDRRIDATASGVPVLVLASREELEIARQVRALLG